MDTVGHKRGIFPCGSFVIFKDCRLYSYIYSKIMTQSLSSAKNQSYLSLMGNETVRELMSSVPQNAQNETIDMQKTFQSVSESVKIPPVDLQEARRGIISFLNGIFFDGPENLSPEFWWEYRYRVLKLLHVSMVLEALNLRSFGMNSAQKNDIPQSLVVLYKFVTEECSDEKLAPVRERFERACETYDPWTRVYLQAFE